MLYIGIEDSASLNSHLTSTDSGVWSEAPRGSGESASPQKGATHVRENSYGGSSGYGSLSSFPGGARPKLPPQVRELSQSLLDTVSLLEVLCFKLSKLIVAEFLY